MGNEGHEIDGVLRITAEFSAQIRILGGHTNWASIQMADAHHDAAQRDEGCGSKAEFFSPQKGSDDDVATSFHLAIGLHDDALTQVIQDKSLMGLS